MKESNKSNSKDWLLMEKTTPRNSAWVCYCVQIMIESYEYHLRFYQDHEMAIKYATQDAIYGPVTLDKFEAYINNRQREDLL